MAHFIGEPSDASYFVIVWSAVASVGWYLVATAIAFWWAFPYIQRKYTTWRIKRDEEMYSRKYHKNPDLLQKRLSAVEASRNKMQEEYNRKCLFVQQEEHEEKGKTTGASRRMVKSPTNERSNEKDKSTLTRSGYYPLMGNNSKGYRPPKRGCCGKGGCG